MKKLTVLLCLLLSMVLSSCTMLHVDWNPMESTVLQCKGRMLSDAEMRFVALEYKTLYESYYHALLQEDFWDSEILPGYSFEQYVLDHFVLNECESLLYLNLIGDKMDIEMDASFRETADEKAARLCASLSPDEKAFAGGDESVLSGLIYLYMRAYEVEKQLLKDCVVEISDEDSRVADVEVIHTKTVSEAREVLSRVRNGENFMTLSKENTIDPVLTYSVSREDLIEPFRSVIFSLHTGEVSEVVEYQGEGFLFRVSAAYNTLLSSKNKRNMLADLRYINWIEKAEAYGVSRDFRLNRAFYDALRLKAEGEYSYHEFFSE